MTPNPAVDCGQGQKDGSPDNGKGVPKIEGQANDVARVARLHARPGQGVAPSAMILVRPEKGAQVSI